MHCILYLLTRVTTIPQAWSKGDVHLGIGYLPGYLGALHNNNMMVHTFVMEHGCVIELHRHWIRIVPAR